MTRLAVRRLALGVLLSLPPPLLRLMAGGGVVHHAGRTLDPRLQFLATRALAGLTLLSPEEARRAVAEAQARTAAPVDPSVSVEALSVQGGDGPVAVRAYRPQGQDPAAPLMVFAHAGGGVMGDLDTAHPFCALLAGVSRGPVLSVDYRLAPEHRFPAGFEDLLAAYHWGRQNAARFGAPPAEAAIGGDGAGASLAAAVCQALHDAGEPQPALQLLIQPWMDIAPPPPAAGPDVFPLSRGLMAWCAGHYLRPGDDPADPRISPGRRSDLSGLAPAVLATAGFDLTAARAEAYGQALREAGVPVIWRRYDSLAHGFTAVAGVVPAAERACREIAGLVRGVARTPA